ncbi:MAG: alginate export family protein [Myxococcales bacterium]|nr:alginate export family protein [Myxococcales bacterium]
MMIGMLALMGTSHAADVDTTFQAQVRPRVEPHSNRDLVDSGSTVLLSSRARVGVDVGVGAFNTLIQVQDVRVWGTETNTLTDFSADGFDVHQAYVGWTSENAMMRLGRQEIIMHEHRLIGSVDWTQQGRSFDGAHARARVGPVEVDAAGVLLESQILEDRNENKGMVAVWGGYRPNKATTVDLVYIGMVDGQDDSVMSTTGAYAKTGKGIVSGRVEGYAQTGTGTTHWLVGARGTVAPKVKGKPAVTLWYDALSGSEGGGGFDTMFATNHKFYGLADIVWFRTGAHQDGRGLQDVALKLSASPAEDLKVGVHGHLFMGTTPIAGLDPVIGQELDVVSSYKLADKIGLAAGAAIFGAPGAEALEGWGFAQVDARF